MNNISLSSVSRREFLGAVGVAGATLGLGLPQFGHAVQTGKIPLGLELYSPNSGGCCDALHVDRLNHNQGAESTLAFLLALAEMKLMQEENKKLRDKNLELTGSTRGMCLSLTAFWLPFLYLCLDFIFLCSPRGVHVSVKD